MHVHTQARQLLCELAQGEESAAHLVHHLLRDRVAFVLLNHR